MTDGELEVAVTALRPPCRVGDVDLAVDAAVPLRS